jgi:hypothetical protein
VVGGVCRRGVVRVPLRRDLLVGGTAGYSDQVAQQLVELGEVRAVLVELDRVLHFMSQLRRDRAEWGVVDLLVGGESVQAAVLVNPRLADSFEERVVVPPRMRRRNVDDLRLFVPSVPLDQEDDSRVLCDASIGESIPKKANVHVARKLHRSNRQVLRSERVEIGKDGCERRGKPDPAGGEVPSGAPIRLPGAGAVTDAGNAT